METLPQTKSELLEQLHQSRTGSRSVPKTHAALRASREHLVRALDALNDADLFKSYWYYEPDETGVDSGKIIIGWIVSNSCGHYLEHLSWIESIALKRMTLPGKPTKAGDRRNAGLE